MLPGGLVPAARHPGARAHPVSLGEPAQHAAVVGFPGFVSKLWLAHDGRGVYRGLYEWDGAERAEHYARSLWRVLELVSEPGSIDFRVVPGLRRDEVLAKPDVLAEHTTADDADWWRVVPA